MLKKKISKFIYYSSFIILTNKINGDFTKVFTYTLKLSSFENENINILSNIKVIFILVNIIKICQNLDQEIF